MKKLAVALLIFLMTSFLAVGYAQLARDMLISGEANATPPYYDVYISNITPDAGAGVLVTNRTATVMTARVSGAGTASFTITVKNQSNKTYVYERVIDGAQASYRIMPTVSAIGEAAGCAIGMAQRQRISVRHLDTFALQQRLKACGATLGI